jgi:hypothetical protein
LLNCLRQQNSNTGHKKRYAGGCEIAGEVNNESYAGVFESRIIMELPQFLGIPLQENWEI